MKMTIGYTIQQHRSKILQKLQGNHTFHLSLDALLEWFVHPIAMDFHLSVVYLLGTELIVINMFMSFPVVTVLVITSCCVGIYSCTH